ncbi:ribonucleoside-diphosphate reductase subunit alpha [Flavobacterium sp.]|jgi:ribonucleoside-diphosphate reductase alpha chain|uniref:ribonucleoside-diphosphate reductase subunit alpha n=1 Tax=Flavobacterium sp. TaxID=239 RepID=UPI0037BE2C1E
MISKNKIKVDYSRDNLFDEMGMRRLKDSYMRDDEKSPQDRFSYVARALGSNVEHAQRLYDYASKHWLSFSTPILSYGTSKRGLPISCYLSYIDDSAEGLVDTLSEVCWLSMLGGGVGIGIGIRAEDGKSVGVMPHLKVYEASSLAYRQGKTRRGSFATYLGISHPNITQFNDMRKPTGDANQRCLELHHGINVTDDFMQIIENCMKDENADDSWPLIDPHTGQVKEIVSAKQLWESILETRMRTGEPYIHFIDASNRGLPKFQKKLGLSVKQSNICTEITLATDAERTAVCCLSSPNLEYWDEWKDNYQFYKDVAELLDNALTLFIKKAPKQVKRAIYSASRERAIGIGALGFHALLQKKGIPFESALAVSINKQIFSRYEKNLKKVNKELAKERGECPDGEGYNVRFSHMISIAPNASSSIIMGNTSPSVEPFRGNAYRQDTLSGSYLNKNQFLEELLVKKVPDDDKREKIWHSIISNAGSVQHLDVLSDYEKDVFKTFSEIDQLWIVQHAADRQVHIDQSQSINLAFKANASIDYLHHVHYEAWKKGLKTIYYCRSDKLYHGESMNKKIERVKFEFDKTTEESCIACEG